MGDTKGGEFDITENVALAMLNDSSTRLNSQVVKPWVNASDITGRNRRMWIIDFGLMSEEQAHVFAKPFDYALQHVKPFRINNRRDAYREKWWVHMEPRPKMWAKIGLLERYIVTPTVAKHRIFVWLKHPTVPDHQLIVFARSDDYFFGVLHSRPHELWSLRMGTSLEDRPRYTPTTTFETFPFPWPPGEEPKRAGMESGDSRLGDLEIERLEAVARWAQALVHWRDEWLNPPPPAKGTLDVAYDRLVKARTLTNLYNGLVYYREIHRNRVFGKNSVSAPAFDRAAFDKETRKSVSPDDIRELDDIHRALDAAVFRAYGWVDADGRPEDLSDEAILERLLALNLARATAS